MILRPITKEEIVDAFIQNNTRQYLVDEIEEKLTKLQKSKRFIKNKFMYGTDGKFTVILFGDKAGCSKRATYAHMNDDENPFVGIAVATRRLLNGVENKQDKVAEKEE
jgi:hypothetical protein